MATAKKKAAPKKKAAKKKAAPKKKAAKKKYFFLRCEKYESPGKFPGLFVFLP